MTSIASPAPPDDETVDPKEARRARLAWAFPIGCTIVVALGFFVPARLSPRPPPPEPIRYASVATPFPDDVPWSPEAIERAQPLMDYRWFLPQSKLGRVRVGPAMISGRLPPEVIHRVVRRSLGEHRSCYQEGLRNNPSLTGRVSVRFVIGRDGAVSSVSNAGSDVPDGGVVSCVVGTFARLRFPSPLGGIVAVSYALSLSP